MSFLEENLDNCRIGFAGEDDVREWFKSKRIPFMQVDIMFKYKGRWCLGEVKAQEKYNKHNPPYPDGPFDGHGLPKWQVQRRLEFYNDTGIEPYLIVKDLEENCLYIESLLTLTKKEVYQTKGKKPRIIFKLDNFKRIEL